MKLMRVFFLKPFPRKGMETNIAARLEMFAQRLSQTLLVVTEIY